MATSDKDVQLQPAPGALSFTALDTRHTNWAGPVAMLAGMGLSMWLFSNQTEYVGLVPAYVPSAGDLTFEAGFLITAVVYLGWHGIERMLAPAGGRSVASLSLRPVTASAKSRRSGEICG